MLMAVRIIIVIYGRLQHVECVSAVKDISLVEISPAHHLPAPRLCFIDCYCHSFWW